MDFFKKFFYQFIAFWKGLKPLQKMSILFLAGGSAIFFVYLIYQANFTNYVPFFPSQELQSANIEDVKKYLDSTHIPYRVRNNSILLIPKKDEMQVRSDLASSGLLRSSYPDKGFELYDTNTWIKGEKELQILEMRAIKGQLERDLTQFDNVRSANVILDIPTQRPFSSGSASKPKASVILSLKPGTHLSHQEVQSISFHVASAVRGLSPDMVAISDTTGKLYQALDHEGELDMIRNAEMSFEEYLKTKVDAMLATIVGFDNYFSTVQVVMNREKTQEERKIYSGKVGEVDLGRPVPLSLTEAGQPLPKEENLSSWVTGVKAKMPDGKEARKTLVTEQLAVPMDSIIINSLPGKIESISIGVLINRHFLASLPPGSSQEQKGEQLRREIQNQLMTILKGYSIRINQAVDLVDFDQSRKALPPPQQTLVVKEEKPNIVAWLALGLAILALLFVLLAWKGFFRERILSKRQQQPARLPLGDLENAVDALQQRYRENPHSIITALHLWMRQENKKS